MAELLRIDPLPAYNFHVRLGVLEFGFSQVSGLARVSEPFTYQEGGVNDRVHVLPGLTKNCGELSLERGAYFGEYFPFYIVGQKLSVPIRIEVWHSDIPMLGGKVFTLSGLVVTKWEVGGLNALQNELLIDKFALSYEHMSFSPV